MSPKVIGIDFDNTIVSYGELFFDLAIEEGLIDQSTRPIKKDIRDCLRQRPQGELAWQRLQALAYGPMIYRARVFDGFKDFLTVCREKAFEVYIVSHKSQFAARDEDRCDLHVAALGFMRFHGLLGEKRYGLAEDRVFFESTRADKIARIDRLRCDAFIDDLMETFREKAFPERTQKIFFNVHQEPCDPGSCVCVSGWNEAIEWLKAK